MPRGYLWRDQIESIQIANKYADSFWKPYLKERNIPHSTTHQYVGGPQAFSDAMLPTWEKSGLDINPINKDSLPAFFDKSPLQNCTVYKTDDISLDNEALLHSMATPLAKYTSFLLLFLMSDMPFKDKYLVLESKTILHIKLSCYLKVQRIKPPFVHVALSWQQAAAPEKL